MKKIVYGDSYISIDKTKLDSLITRISYCPVNEVVTIYHKYGVLAELTNHKSNLLDSSTSSVDEYHLYGITLEDIYNVL